MLLVEDEVGIRDLVEFHLRRAGFEVITTDRADGVWPLLDAADAAGRELRQMVRTGHDIDHPVTYPEGAYLKAGFFNAL